MRAWRESGRRVLFRNDFGEGRSGWGNRQTRNLKQPLVFIEFRVDSSRGIYDEIAPLYDQGLSISDIADQTGFGRTAIWKTLKTHGIDLRPQTPVTFERWRQGRGKTRARPPYGFCYFQGEVIKDPKEYPVLQLILNLKALGESLGGIQRTLEKKKLRSRTGKPWSYNVIKAVASRSYKNLPLDPKFKGKSNTKSKSKKKEK